MQSMRRSIDGTLEVNMVDGLFCATGCGDTIVSFHVICMHSAYTQSCFPTISFCNLRVGKKRDFIFCPTYFVVVGTTCRDPGGKSPLGDNRAPRVSLAVLETCLASPFPHGSLSFSWLRTRQQMWQVAGFDSQSGQIEDLETVLAACPASCLASRAYARRVWGETKTLLPAQRRLNVFAYFLFVDLST